MADLREVLLQAGVPTKESGVNVGRGMINICCPFCREQRYHCGIHETQLWFHCFVCSESGNWNRIKEVFEKEYSNVNWNVSKNSGNFYFEEASEQAMAVEANKRWIEIPEDDKELVEWITKSPNNLKKEFRTRGIDLNLALDAGLKKGIGKLDGYAVFSEKNNIVARKFSKKNDGPKWWKQKDVASEIYGRSFVEQKEPKLGVITEGVFDFIRIPLGSGVAILGSSISPNLIQQIITTFSKADEILLALDRDVKGKTIRKFTLQLNNFGYGVRTLDWNRVDPDIKDLDEVFLSYGQEAFFEFLDCEELQEQNMISFL